ncbi:membrane protein BRI3 [Mantella aurantiaca]
MDDKPLLQDRPPAYNSAAVQEEQQPNYGTIPVHPRASALAAHPPPPYAYPYHTGQGYISSPQVAQALPILHQPTAVTSVVVVGGCPACRVGVLEDSFTCLGIFCAIFFFPIGILFCLALRQRRCPNCGATFG